LHRPRGRLAVKPTRKTTTRTTVIHDPPISRRKKPPYPLGRISCSLVRHGRRAGGHLAHSFHPPRLILGRRSCCHAPPLFLANSQSRAAERGSRRHALVGIRERGAGHGDGDEVFGGAHGVDGWPWQHHLPVLAPMWTLHPPLLEQALSWRGAAGRRQWRCS
jgi:hypothetical protein